MTHTASMAHCEFIWVTSQSVSSINKGPHFNVQIEPRSVLKCSYELNRRWVLLLRKIRVRGQDPVDYSGPGYTRADYKCTGIISASKLTSNVIKKTFCESIKINQRQAIILIYSSSQLHTPASCAQWSTIYRLPILLSLPLKEEIWPCVCSAVCERAESRWGFRAAHFLNTQSIKAASQRQHLHLHSIRCWHVWY